MWVWRWLWQSGLGGDWGNVASLGGLPRMHSASWSHTPTRRGNLSADLFYYASQKQNSVSHNEFDDDDYNLYFGTLAYSIISPKNSKTPCHSYSVITFTSPLAFIQQTFLFPKLLRRLIKVFIHCLAELTQWNLVCFYCWHESFITWAQVQSQFCFQRNRLDEGLY